MLIGYIAESKSLQSPQISITDSTISHDLLAYWHSGKDHQISTTRTQVRAFKPTQQLIYSKGMSPSSYFVRLNVGEACWSILHCKTRSQSRSGWSHMQAFHKTLSQVTSAFAYNKVEIPILKATVGVL